ncbi:hypothetical protein F5884DRAFT_682931 [Xylogone sp. PMI_703]|nr:hypothetical protein F5884DRAFT_682931 [Xylogone sp. PMI_703]
MDPFANLPPYEEKKRTRIRLSCTACRQKKLKCDRRRPCDNCVKKGQPSSCQYISPEPRSLGQYQSGGLVDIRGRLRRLEELVVALRRENLNNRREKVDATETHEAASSRDNREAAQRKLSDEPETQKDHADSPGTMVVDRLGTRYVDAAHWQAILNEVGDSNIFLTPSLKQLLIIIATNREVHGLRLLLGASSSVTKLDLLESLPPRPVVDRLVSQFFNSKEPGISILHVPTFRKEYAEFWEDPQRVPVAWIGLLYGIMCTAAIIYFRTGDILPEPLGDPLEISDIYKTRVAQCLILANYTTSGRYKIESLLVYLGTEFRGPDAEIGVSVLLSIIVRLAMHMGYHRDSKHYKTISVFDGEMRRRVWALISQIDNLVSFQVGLSKAISDSHCDTDPPSNLLDEDFHEGSDILPVSRPETERTTVSYTIAKGRIMSVFGQISDKTYSLVKMPYEEVTRLDKYLQDAQASLPPFLKTRPMSLSITDSADVIMQRYNIDLLYQKSRCVLHRKYLTDVHSDQRYSHSRRTCIDAAKQILKHQSDIHQETLPGGLLYRDRWFVSSLTSHDFLLAAMILCLNLSHVARRERRRRMSEGNQEALQQNREELLEILETSYCIWTSYQDRSAEARKAAEALGVMLGKTRNIHADSSRAGQSSSTDKNNDKSMELRADQRNFQQGMCLSLIFDNSPLFYDIF